MADLWGDGLMQAGRLDRRITLEAPTHERSSSGAAVPSWSTFATVWAGVKSTRGAETFAQDRDVASREAIFSIRWMAGVKADQRIQYDGLTWDIVHIAELGRRDGLEISARAIS